MEWQFVVVDVSGGTKAAAAAAAAPYKIEAVAGPRRRHLARMQIGRLVPFLSAFWNSCLFLPTASVQCPDPFLTFVQSDQDGAPPPNDRAITSPRC